MRLFRRCVPRARPAERDACIVLNISTASSASGPSSRAAGHDFSAATLEENKIDIDGDDYRVYVFGKDGRLLERFIPTEKMSVVNETHSSYTISGRITQTAFMGNADGSYESLP